MQINLIDNENNINAFELEHAVKNMLAINMDEIEKAVKLSVFCDLRAGEE